MTELRGVIAPATTPFDDAGEIDFAAVRRQTGWLIDKGVRGIAAGGSTGEGHTLAPEEFRALIENTLEAAAGRVPVIAGVITDSTRDGIKRGRMVADLDIAALQVTPVHYLFRPDDDSMLAHFRALTEETGKAVIIYNVVPWTYLSPALLLRILREVPGVVGVKQSAGDLKLFADLVLQAGPEDLIFSAVDALLYPSYALGAQGSIAAILSAAPRASVDLWDAVAAGDHAKAKALHEKLLVLWNAISADNLPACTKYAQSLQGCPAGLPRRPMPPASEVQRPAIRAALEGLGASLRDAAE
jgi:4-hydroxy-tetrahydrodipicolinate synthase